MSFENPTSGSERAPAEIRSATEADMSRLAYIARTAREHNLPYLPKLHTPEEDQEHFRETVFREDHVVIAAVDGDIVGFCAFKDDWLDHLYILPEHQGKGIGRLLLDRAKGASDRLQLWVFQRNADAIEFYEKHGFELVETTDGKANEEKEPDALYLWKNDNHD